MVATTAAPTVIIFPAIAIGLAIGIYEALVLHRDVTIPTHRFGHMLHALILAVIFVFISMNVAYVHSLIPALKSIPVLKYPIAVQIAVGLIAVIKIHGVSAALKSTGMSSHGMSETWIHSLIIGVLIVAAPYAYMFIAPSLPLPAWMK
jgi:hypothetical protein